MGRKYTRIAARGKELKLQRLARGYTQREFAKMIGISHQQLSMIENGASGASEEVALAISSKLRCDFDKVFDVVVPYNATEEPMAPREARDPLLVSNEPALFAKA